MFLPYELFKGSENTCSITFCVACEKKILETHVYFFQFLTTVFGETAKCDFKLTNTVTCSEFWTHSVLGCFL